MTRAAVLNDKRLLQVGFEKALGVPLAVTNIVAKGSASAAYFTLGQCHSLRSLIYPPADMFVTCAERLYAAIAEAEHSTEKASAAIAALDATGEEHRQGMHSPCLRSTEQA